MNKNGNLPPFKALLSMLQPVEWQRLYEYVAKYKVQQCQTFWREELVRRSKTYLFQSRKGNSYLCVAAGFLLSIHSS